MSYADFLRPNAERSAAPDPRDREPEKRNQPPTPEHAPAPVERDPRAFTADAIETWRKAQQLEVDVQGVLSTRFFMNQTPHGTTAVPGAMPWNWCYGRQPVHVKGAVYADTEESRHLVRGIGEAQAAREYREEFLRSIGADGISKSRMRRFERKADR